MVYKKRILISFFFIGTLIFTACGGGPDLGGKNAFIYNGHNFGDNRNAEFQQGVRDGCKTSTGDYRKDHGLFNNNNSYHTGWEDGRVNCKGK